MGKVAKCLVGIPGALFGFIGETLKANIVYLTIFGIVSVSWFAAWSRSIDQFHRRMMLPAFDKSELPESSRDDIDESTRAELDEEVIGE